MVSLILKVFYVFILSSLMFGTACFAQSGSKRIVISLNGYWQVAEGSLVMPTGKFDHTVPVPGLVTMAQPSFKNAAPKVKDRKSMPQSDPLRQAFWYRRKFTLDRSIPLVAILRIAKAKYGTRVILNGKDLGTHLPNFTPGYFDVVNALKKGENELMVRVGASRGDISDSIPDGLDYEKVRYIPGIYDDVQLILSGSPFIVRVQAAPDIIRKELQVQLTLNPQTSKNVHIVYTVTEGKSQKIAGYLKKHENLKPNEENIINVRIPIENCHLWSPDDPFLYKLKVTTEGDEKEVKFGMRDFHFDHLTNHPMLNGKPYFMRGSNITIFRFFEDTARGTLPWDTTWVRNLFKSFKQFHWNTLRFCIGFPPTFWYNIADEEGFLLQNEFPIWYGGIGWNRWPKALTVNQLEKEYTEMIYEYWNHPSVVIWDGSNENLSDNGQTCKTGEAIWRVRNLDISNRPWDNSYGYKRAPGDVYEVHPYHFFNPNFKLRYISSLPVTPIEVSQPIPNFERFPVIINEYGWLWLNRDGSPTTLTEKLYDSLLGANATPAERWHLYANYMAAETEYWRCHRKAAGVLIFTALGYSRPDGQTSDFFVNPAKLEYQKDFMEYLPNAFNPVGLMLDEWGNEIECNKIHNFKIMAVNDLGKVWNGNVQLQILQEGKIISQKSSRFNIPPYGQKEITISSITPHKPGNYIVVALLKKEGEKTVKSIREIPFK